MIVNGTEFFTFCMFDSGPIPATQEQILLGDPLYVRGPDGKFPLDKCGDYVPYSGPRPLLETKKNMQKVAPLLLGAGQGGEDSLPVSAVGDQFTDMRMAAFLSAMFSGVLRYWVEAGKWIVFDGCRWATDIPGGAHVHIRAMIDKLYKMAVQCGDSFQTAGMLKAILKLETHARHEAILSCARTRPELIVTVADLDKHRMLINVQNGTIDLENMSLRPHSADDLLTRTMHVKYDPSEKCPLFLAFLNRILNQNQDIIGFLQRFFGYCLTGHTTEQVFLFLYGRGANGKSVLLNIIRALFGDFASNANSDLLMIQDNRASTNDIAALLGSRVVTISELNEDARMDEARVKSLTGGDSVTCRFLFKELFTYTPEFKILCAGNHKPKIRGNDLGIWRRQILIPFEVTIPEEERDPKLQDKLIKELPGILAWAVQGCAGWQKTGLNPPQEVKTATDEYRKSEDVFAQWLDECCATGSHMITTAKDLLDSFIEFSKWRGTTATKMGLMLSDAGFTRDRSTGHSRWVGLGLTRTADNRHWQDKDDESDRPF